MRILLKGLCIILFSAEWHWSGKEFLCESAGGSAGASAHQPYAASCTAKAASVAGSGMLSAQYCENADVTGTIYLRC